MHSGREGRLHHLSRGVVSRKASWTGLASLLGSSLVATVAFGQGPGYSATGAVTPMPDEKLLTERECGACHAPFPPEFQSMHGWWEIMHNLDSHMGEVATLPEETRVKIQNYLLAKASDGPNTERRHAR
jgi:Dihaem cytochrome c